MEKDKYVYGRGGKTEKKKEENIWKRKAYFWLRRRKRGKYSEKENIFYWRRRRRGKAFVEGQYFCAEEKKGRE